MTLMTGIDIHVAHKSIQAIAPRLSDIELAATGGPKRLSESDPGTSAKAMKSAKLQSAGTSARASTMTGGSEWR
jgi:hypothetical protein